FGSAAGTMLPRCRRGRSRVCSIMRCSSGVWREVELRLAPSERAVQCVFYLGGTMQFTRRDLGKLALAAVPVPGLLAAKPDSKFDGVQIGVITYSYRSMPGANDARELLKYIVDSGVSGIELMGPAAEIYAGSPAGSGADELKRWRLSVSMDKYKELRK